MFWSFYFEALSLTYGTEGTVAYDLLELVIILYFYIKVTRKFDKAAKSRTFNILADFRSYRTNWVRTTYSHFQFAIYCLLISIGVLFDERYEKIYDINLGEKYVSSFFSKIVA